MTEWKEIGITQVVAICDRLGSRSQSVTSIIGEDSLADLSHD